MSDTLICMSFFFFNDTATTEIYTLSLHDALPIFRLRRAAGRVRHRQLDDAAEEKPGRRRAGAREDRARDRRADRKSTRLNSSHSQISYAVFCLKKKKNNKQTRSIPSRRDRLV